MEFALVAFPFLFLIFAIIELGLSFTVQQMLAHATEDGAGDFIQDKIRKKIQHRKR
ncbi:pilus assembly protein [Pseudochrobactrum algeriensis]|uniref:TadE/TadG family type IV pilus assembly protein n=1 Tax=Pseudochrobactrum algeriensis TaxID=2834768 RepID=UPI001BCDB0FF|nr:pilus assembly protein [Pseudochrobactrum algeriensis]